VRIVLQRSTESTRTATVRIPTDKTSLRFFVIYAVIGLVGAWIVITLFPGLLTRDQSAVEIHEVTAPAVPGTGPVSYADAVALAAPAVVNVYTTKVIQQRENPLFDDPLFRRFFGDINQPRRRLQNSLGSGVIISDQGYVLTNNHVIAEADEILVALNDGRTVQAQLVGADPESDIAVLKIDLTPLPSVTLASGGPLRVGDVVLAIGNPFGVGQTVTQGIISATGRSQLGISIFEDFIQTDAAINPGNSGGALINAHGHLVGINTAIYSRSGGSQGIGFAIPLSIAKKVMEEIIQYGHAVRGWLGIEPQDLTPRLAESFGLRDVTGVIVAGVLAGGPADNAGLRRGDIITHINDQPVEDGQAALNVISRTTPGTKVEIRLIRAGKPTTTTATVIQRPVPGK
jgi:serine protease DegS